MRRQLTKRICLYGNPTLDLIQDRLGTRWQYGGGVFYSSLPLIMHGFEVEIHSIITHSIIDHPVYKFVVPFQYSSKYNIFHIKYDSIGSRTLEIIQSAPPLYNYNIHEGECITIVNPVLQEISINLIKELSVKSSMVAGDIQGFIRRRQGSSLVLDRGPSVFEALKEIELIHMDIEEARALTNEASCNGMIDKLASISHGKTFVITSGPGDVILVSDERVSKIPHSGDVRGDTTGAGDFFLGALIAYLTVSNDILESVFKSIEETERWLEKRLHRHPPSG